MSTTLKAYRKKLGMTQEDLAAEVGVDQATISHWERGKVVVPDHQLEKLAKVFDVGADELYDWKHSPVMITKQPESWRDHVVAESELSPFAMLILMALPVYADKKTGIVSATEQQLRDASKVPAKTFKKAMEEAIASGYVRRLGSVEYAFELTYPED